jgi:hypothetical protein
VGGGELVEMGDKDLDDLAAQLVRQPPLPVIPTPPHLLVAACPARGVVGGCGCGGEEEVEGGGVDEDAARGGAACARRPPRCWNGRGGRRGRPGRGRRGRERRRGGAPDEGHRASSAAAAVARSAAVRRRATSRASDCPWTGAAAPGPAARLR